MILVAPSHPPRRFVVREPPSTASLLGPDLAMPEPEKEVRIPPFFDDDHDGRRLAEAIYRMVNGVYLETGSRAERVELGRFTFIEFLAHSENRAEMRRVPMRYARFDAGTISAEFIGAELRLAPGPDHFIRGVPVAGWTLAHGACESFFVSPGEVYRAADAAIAKALRSVPPRP